MTKITKEREKVVYASSTWRTKKLKHDITSSRTVTPPGSPTDTANNVSLHCSQFKTYQPSYSVNNNFLEKMKAAIQALLKNPKAKGPYLFPSRLNPIGKHGLKDVTKVSLKQILNDLSDLQNTSQNEKEIIAKIPEIIKCGFNSIPHYCESTNTQHLEKQLNEIFSDWLIADASNTVLKTTGIQY